jgi:hypothetical protein
MASEITTSTPNWTALQGKILDGGYEIAECLLTSSESASFRIRVLGDRSTHAVVNVFTPNAAPLEQYLLWQEALELRHPQISSPISVGRLEWEGASYPYVVLHKADENLAGVIRDRALTTGEAREVLRSVGAGLEYLHANGFVHSALSPEHVLALGDAIRISSTTIRRINTPVEDGEPDVTYKAPESSAENLTVAADIWCTGATLFEVLTQKKCTEDCREQAKSLPEPFDWIVERCLDPEPHERPTLSEVFAMLSGAVKRPQPPKEEAEPAVMAAGAGASTAVASSPASPELSPSVASASEPAPAAAVASTAAPVTASAAAAPAEAPRSADPASSPRRIDGTPRGARSRTPQVPPARPAEPLRPKLTASPKPVYTENRPRSPLLADDKPEESPRVKFLSYAFLAIMVAGGLLWLARPKPEKPHLTTVSPGAHTQTVPPEPASPAGTPPVPGSSAAVSQAPAGIPASHQTAAGASGVAAMPASSWRVVVFTFAHKDDAARQAQALNAKHPGFDPQVFSPDAKGPYLIVLGGPMTRDEASRVRQKARSIGFPHDAYIQNFSH